MIGLIKHNAPACESRLCHMTKFNRQKIFWHSRRGMLELDLLLLPFAEDVFDTLSNKEQLLYSELLEQEDQDLFAWLVGKTPPSDVRFEPIIRLILAHSSK